MWVLDVAKQLTSTFNMEQKSHLYRIRPKPSKNNSNKQTKFEFEH